jgi:hypothetical protein
MADIMPFNTGSVPYGHLSATLTIWRWTMTTNALRWAMTRLNMNINGAYKWIYESRTKRNVISSFAVQLFYIRDEYTPWVHRLLKESPRGSHVTDTDQFNHLS